MVKVKLRELKISDLNRLCELFINDNVLENLAFPFTAKQTTKEMEFDWLKKQIKNYEQDKPSQFNLAIIVDGLVVGNIGVHTLHSKENWVEFGYWLGEDYWGQGIATEAVKNFSKIIFKKYNMVPMAEPFLLSIASQRVLEKAGFKFVELRKEVFEKFGKKFDTKVYIKKFN
jgi:[ribosomal protein S5]-alanine N-acetyltransferase